MQAEVTAEQRPIRGLALVVLAGGRSRRMGQDKALIELDGEPLLSLTLRRFGPIAETSVVAAGAVSRRLPAMPSQVQVVHDAVPDQGPLAGLAAVRSMLADSVTHAFVCACDTPFLDPGLPSWLLRRLGGAEAAVPVVADRPQVLAAVYTRSLLARATELFDADERSVRALAGLAGVTRIAEAELRGAGFSAESFFNVNAPEDLERARARLR